MLPELKEALPWLKLSYSQSLQQVSKHLWKAYDAFFKGIRGKPTFKKKSKNRDSFCYPQNFEVGRNSIKIPKIGRVRMVKHRPLQGKPCSLTVSQDGDQWFAVIICSIELDVPEEPVAIDLIGIDLGIKFLAVLDDGTYIPNIKPTKKYENKLRREQKRLSRKKNGSKNRAKQRLRVFRVHRKIRNMRENHRQQATHHITTKYNGFALENLNVAGMLKNHKLAKAIQDCAWGAFVRTLGYKAQAQGKPMVQIDRWFPSSQLCSLCGSRKLMPLNQREYVCEECGVILCRDLNSSKNIRSEGTKILLKGCVI